MTTATGVNSNHDPLAFLRGGGQMGELIRRHDWRHTALGLPADWPASLKSAVSSVLNSATAMHISWGEDLLQFYNDAYVPVLTDGKHPAALGRSARATFPEIWDFIGPLFDRVVRHGEAIAMENAGLVMYRDGVLKESFFSFSYSPLRALCGTICGVAVVCWETTEDVILRRREGGLRVLTEELAAADSLDAVRDAVGRQVDGNRGDLPFLLWFERDESLKSMRLAKCCGIAPEAPLIAELGDQDEASRLGRALDSHEPVAHLLSLPEPATQWLVDAPAALQVECIAIEPLCYVNHSVPDAYLVFGVGPKRPIDGAAKNFHASVCHAVERAVRRISAVDLERREAARQFDVVTAVVPSMVWICDAQGRCTFVSKRWLAFTGWSEEDSLGLGWMAGIHPDDLAAVNEATESAFACCGPLHTQYRFLRADGQYRWMLNEGLPRCDDGGQFLGMVGSSLDITDRKVLEEELLRQAAEDPLTGLANRRHFHGQLVQACQDASRRALPAALIFMDLDHFKTVNDSLTHEAGDVVLREISARLRQVVGGAGLVSRLGGDEFAIILPAHAPPEAAAVARAIAAAVAQPFFVESVEVFLTASLGVATAPNDAADADGLISCADLAMYEVKRHGRNGVSHYQPHLRAAPASMLSLRGRMARGLQRDEFFPLFQPIASVVENRIVATEALLRWLPSEGDAIGPSAFIPVAEETGLIVPLSERMMAMAFAQSAAWTAQGHPLMMSVNLSARQLRAPDICRRILALATEHGVAPETVQLEITESVLMERLRESERQLLVLKEMGFRVALDDFGTGYSSLAYLKSFPVDSIKIDGSFIRGLTNNPRDAAIVRTIVSMSRDLGITTVAEGVETAAELHMIAALGCNFYQGYVLARAIPGEALVRLLH